MTTDHHIDLRLRWFIFLLLFALYLLIYTGIPDSADGKALLAVANSMVRQGDADISVFGAEDARFQLERSRMGVFGQDGGYYSKKGITPSLTLLPFVALAQVAPWLSPTALAMLLNIVVTAATAVVVYTFARNIGFRPRVALATALIYGIGTTAFVYAKTLYGEPLAGLLLISALLAAYRYRSAGEVRNLLMVGAFVGLAMGINLTYALMLPFIGGYALLKRSVDRRLVRDAALLLATFALMLIGIGLYNWLRFGNPLTSGYYFSSGEGFTKPFLAGLFGLTFSPYRGIFWYSPVLLLAILGWFWLRRQQPILEWIILLLIVTQLASYASWWSWHGGITWGPRFLLPILPLAALLLAPVVERADHARPLRWVLGVLVILSVGVQLLGALYSYFPFTGHLMRTYPSSDENAIVDYLSDKVLVDPAASPIVGHFQMLFDGAQVDPRWLTDGIQPALLIIAAVLVLVAFVILRLQNRGRLVGVGAAILALQVIGSCGVTIDCQAAASLQQAIQPSATTVIASANYESILPDVKSGRIIAVNAPTTPDDPLASRLWANALARAEDGLLWYVSWFPPADVQNWQERELWSSAAFALQRDTDGHRALLFHLDPPAPQSLDELILFSDIALAACTIEITDGGIFVSLEWQAQDTLTSDYSWFVHLIDANGNILAQQDRAPQGVYMPTSAWQDGQRVTDYLYFPLDAAAIDRAIGVRVGWVDPQTGSRLLDSDDGFIVVPVR
jgi:4-amino-4-deoxy-L-arabinose transferase-like glycosyltransferase